MQATRHKKIRYAFIAVLAAVATILLLWGTRNAFLHIQYKCPNQDYFANDTYSEIFHITYPSTFKTASKLMKQVDEAFSFIGTGFEAEKRFGELSRYSALIESYPNVACEEHRINFIASSFHNNTGYLWFSYYNRLYDNNHSSISGSGSLMGKCLVRLTLNNVNAEWIVENIEEHP